MFWPRSAHTYLASSENINGHLPVFVVLALDVLLKAYGWCE